MSLAPHIDLRFVETGAGKSSEARVPIAPMPRDVVFGKRVGTLYSDSRRTVAVTLDKQRKELVVGRAPETGTYSGQIDVNGTKAKGGTSEVTLDVRHGWLLPLAVLLGGIGVGFGVEWWLTRLRPRSLLDRRLGRLLERAERRHQAVDTQLKGLFLESHGLSRNANDTTRAAWLAEHNLTHDDLVHGIKGQWALPRAAVADSSADLPQDEDPRNRRISRYHLSRAARDLAALLHDARTDIERELFGPDGDRIKELLTDEDTYAELVEELREAAYTLRGPLHDIAADFPGKRSPMRERLDDACDGWTIGDRQYLVARRDAAKAFHAAAEQYAGFRARLQTAIDELPVSSQTLRECIVSRRRLLDTTFRGDADQVTFWAAELTRVEAAAYAGGTALTSLTPGPAELPHIAPLERAPDRPADRPASPEPKAASDSPWPAGRWVVRGAGFTRLEWLVGIVSLVTIAATGMSLLYFTNDTFGSLGDYLAIALWGSTATAGVALLRRLLPGATSTRLPGVGS
jgi:hypothetical protein